MNKDDSKIKVGMDHCKSFLKVSLTITDEYCNSFESVSSPSGSAFKLSDAERTMLLAVCHPPETHFILQEIVSLTKLNEIVNCTFV